MDSNTKALPHPGLCSVKMEALAARLHAGAPLLMGVLNVTPDSFSDGSPEYADVDSLVVRAEGMVQAGADIVDVGGESTRPGAAPVSGEVEARRVVPVVEALTQRGLPAAISIDTTKADVARAALCAGASIVNDVSMLRDPQVGRVAARADAVLIIMHSRGTPQTMQQAPSYRDVVAEVCRELAEAVRRAQQAGVDRERIWLDPGLGFGKTIEHNLALIKGLARLKAMGHPVVLGASRKRFLGSITGQEEPRARDLATAVTTALVAAEDGADVFRVHDVVGSREALAVVRALKKGDTHLFKRNR